MKNNFLYVLLVIIIAVSGCSQHRAAEIKQQEDQIKTYETEKLIKFFTTCNSDIVKAVQVIADYKMIANLTHLKRMDMEGRKYYLLERENLTKMIKAVTEGTYSDLILINKSGVIIYTMLNDEIFGQNVKTHLKDTALNTCFINSSQKGFYVEDISIFPSSNGTPKLFVSYPDKIEDFIRGVFIIQINSEIFKSIFEKIPIITGMDGKYRLDKNDGNILQPYKYFDKIIPGNGRQYFEIENKKYSYYQFKFNSLSWVIISE
ncbi:MAG: hypothetical protein V1874_03415 [Spirochaetota bacterium]